MILPHSRCSSHSASLSPLQTSPPPSSLSLPLSLSPSLVAFNPRLPLSLSSPLTFIIFCPLYFFPSTLIETISSTPHSLPSLPSFLLHVVFLFHTGKTGRQTRRQAYRQTQKQADKQTGRQTRRHKDRPTDRQTVRQSDRQTDRTSLCL